ncbi:unnamed protein product, partial [Pylaiella littoralis]
RWERGRDDGEIDGHADGSGQQQRLLPACRCQPGPGQSSFRGCQCGAPGGRLDVSPGRIYSRLCPARRGSPFFGGASRATQRCASLCVPLNHRVVAVADIPRWVRGVTNVLWRTAVESVAIFFLVSVF